MHLVVELLVVAGFIATMVQAARSRRDGGWLVLSLVAAAWVRESFVVVVRWLYGFAPLTLMLGRTPLLSVVIWGFSIVAALVWAEAVLQRRDAHLRPDARVLAGVAVFMLALACFYEPFLRLAGMAHWEAGTRATAGVPWIALVGYPTLATALLALHAALVRRFPAGGARAAVLAVAMSGLAVAHAAGLTALKAALGW